MISSSAVAICDYYFFCGGLTIFFNRINHIILDFGEILEGESTTRSGRTD